MSARTPPDATLAWWVFVAPALLALAPPILLHHTIGQLYWFGDEWHLLLQVKEMGFWHWIPINFAENICPLWKLLWGGAVFAFHGSYAAMVTLNWLTHALNVLLLGILLHRFGFGRFAIVGSLLVFGLSFTNIETLTWSVQWSAVLSYTFLLLALLLHSTLAQSFSAPRLLALAALVLASALAFSRGVLAGAIIAVLTVFPPTRDERLTRRQVAYTLLATLLPAGAFVLVTHYFAALPNGVIPRDFEVWIAVAKFACTFFFLNPLSDLVRGAGGPLVIGIVEAAVLAGGLWISRGLVRRGLWLLLLFHWANSTLVALGRWHTLPPAAMSSRYQYGPLLCWFPFLMVSLERLTRQLRREPAALLQAVAGAALVALAVHGWPREARWFTEAHGALTRHLLAAGDTRDAPPQIPPLWAGTARDIVAYFNLH